jgi:signal peptidase
MMIPQSIFIISVLLYSGYMLFRGMGEPPLLLHSAWVVVILGFFISLWGERRGRKWKGFLYDIASAIWVVSIIILFSYCISATWPVMVAVESSSMEPNIYPGDLVFILGTERAQVITREMKGDHLSFGGYGDVIVYKPHGDPSRTPIIHRAIGWIEEGEVMPHGRFNAPHSGYLTLGDNNQGRYDPLPVKPEWVIGVAKFRVPLFGYFRLLFPKV